MAPCVVKAPDRQGQRGLTFVRTEEELPAAIEAAIEASRNGVYIVEEYVDGPEVTVQAVSIDGVFHPLLVADRLTADPPAFGVALAHAWPCVSEHKVRSRRLAPRPRRSGFGTGRRTRRSGIGEDGSRVVELAARLGGGHDAELAEAATGVKLNDLALDFALGNEACVSETQSLHGGACVLFLVAPEGVLRAVEGREEAHAVEGVLDVRIYREPGHSGSGRCGAAPTAPAP